MARKKASDLTEQEKQHILTVFWQMPDNAIFDEVQVAVVCNRSQSWVQHARTYGGGPAFKKGVRAVGYSKCDVVSYLNSLTSYENTSQKSQVNLPAAASH